ncbi:MAG TPA: DUF881 domain-containing protein [bacterium]|nr:DUF881 domain-containing protein [bacterium]
MRQRQWQYGFAILLLLAGFLFVLQVRADQALRTGAALPSRRLEDLTVLLRRQQEADRSLRDELAALRKKLDDYRTAEAGGESMTAQMRHEVAQLWVVLGRQAVQGPGLVVTLAASPRRLVTPQAQDVSAVVNELWAAGAEAVVVNGVRVLAVEGFAPAAGGVRFRTRVLRDPFKIVAIGDPATLEGALLVRGGLVDGLEGVGLNVTLSRSAHFDAPASDAPLRFHYARPAGPP